MSGFVRHQHGIQTKTTGGRYSVCRVAGEEDPALAICFSYLCSHDPRTDIFDSCLREWLSNCLFNESETFFVGVVFSVFKLGFQSCISTQVFA